MSLCIFVKGGGDLGTGVAWRLHRCGFNVLVTEIEQPSVIRRKVAFASAVYEQSVHVENVEARLIGSLDGLAACWSGHKAVAVMVDPDAKIIDQISPDVLVDAIIAKRNLGTRIKDAPVVIALGPGFLGGSDCHAVIETNRGHNLGRVIWKGSAEANTGIPGTIGGANAQRILLAPKGGIFHALQEIGNSVRAGEIIALVDQEPVQARVSGVVRGLLHEGLPVTPGMKIGDVDPRGIQSYCYSISDKALAVAGGVLEAVLTLTNKC
jgi:xanthine dehydrogenase accessory factor